MPPVSAGNTVKCHNRAAMTKLPITVRDREYFKTKGAIKETQIMTQKILKARPEKPILYHLIMFGRKK